MSYLLRVELPDVPGSLGRVASAIGSVGGNIEAIEIVEHTAYGAAVDDVFLKAEHDVMPDAIISALNALDGVRVHWISRYAAGANLTLDLEAVEEMTRDPQQAANLMLDMIPEVFRVDWGLRLRRSGSGFEVVHRTPAAPDAVPEGLMWPAAFTGATRFELPAPYTEVIVAGCPLGPAKPAPVEMVVIARRGGPEILDSELARLQHLCGLATSIAAKG